MAIKDITFGIKATFKDMASKGLKTLNNAMRQSEQVAEKSMRGQEKLVRRMAAQNTKAFNIAALSVGPLVRAYAEVAAALWAVERVWNVIDIGAKFLETSDSFKVLGAQFGYNAEVMKTELKALAGDAITTQNLMQNASLALASGLSTDQLEKLTVTARKAARAMGRSMPDAYDRIVRAVTKLEPELLDEIGLTTRLQNILGDYAKSVGKSVDQITSLEKTQIFTNAVIEEGIKKFGAIDVSTKSWAERLETIKIQLIDTGTQLVGTFVPVIVTAAEVLMQFSSNVTVTVGALLAYRAGLAVIRKEQNMAAIASRSTAAAELALSEAYRKQNIAAAAITTAKATKNKAAIKEAQLEWELTRQHVLHTKAALETAKADIAAAKAVTFKSVAIRGLGKAFRFLTGPIGIVIFAITELLAAMGVFDTIFGGAETASDKLAERIKKLTENQKEQLAVTEQLHLDTAKVVDAMDKGRVSVDEFGKGYQTLTVEIKDANDQLERHIILQKRVDGKLQKVNFVGVNAEVLSDVNKQLEVAKVRLDKLSGFTGFFKRIFAFGTDAKAEAQAQVDLLKTVQFNLEKSGLEQAKHVDKVFTHAKKAIISLDDILKDTGTNIKDIEKDMFTKSQALENKIVASEQALTKAKNKVSEYAKEIINVKALDTTEDGGLVKRLENERVNVIKLIPQIKKYIEKLKELRAGRAKKAQQSLLEAMIEGDIKALESQKNTQTTSLSDSKNYFDKLKDLYSKSEDAKLARLQEDLDKEVITTEEYALRAYKLRATTITQLEKLNIDFKNREKDLEIGYWEEIAANDDNSYTQRLNALETYLQVSLAKEGLTAAEKARIIREGNKKLEDLNNERILKEGSIYEILKLKHKKYVDDLKSNNEILADSFIETSKIISDTLLNQVGKSIGLLTDEAKTLYKEQLIAAQQSYQGMVDAANQAFGTSLGNTSLDKQRGLQDIEIGRVRNISDVLAGGGDAESIQKDVRGIQIDTRRKQEDLQLSTDRKTEDAKSERANSLLDAQRELNKALLEANQEYSDANKQIWVDMYDSIKETTFNSLSEIMMAEFNKAVFGVESTEQAEQKKAEAGAQGATGTLKTKLMETILGVGIDAPAIISKASALLGPFGPPIGAAIVAGIVSMTSGLAAKAIPIPSIAGGGAASIKPPVLKMHTGGTISGASEEVPFIGLKGEGILNKHNGMKAAGGPSGVDFMNATGKTPITNMSKGNTQVTIQIVDSSGNTKDALTISDWDSWLRGQGGKIMRNVTRDGNIIIDKKGIA